MKLFLVEYGWTASGPETSVIIADSIDEAKKFASTVANSLVFVDSEPKDDRVSGYKVKECMIREIPFDTGVIYTGNYCR